MSASGGVVERPEIGKLLKSSENGVLLLAHADGKRVRAAAMFESNRWTTIDNCRGMGIGWDADGSWQPEYGYSSFRNVVGTPFWFWLCSWAREFKSLRCHQCEQRFYPLRRWSFSTGNSNHYPQQRTEHLTMFGVVFSKSLFFILCLRPCGGVAPGGSLSSLCPPAGPRCGVPYSYVGLGHFCRTASHCRTWGGIWLNFSGRNCFFGDFSIVPVPCTWKPCYSLQFISPCFCRVRILSKCTSTANRHSTINRYYSKRKKILWRYMYFFFCRVYGRTWRIYKKLIYNK